MTAITVISIEATYVDCDGILRHKNTDERVNRRNTIIDSKLAAKLAAKLAQ